MRHRHLQAAALALTALLAAGSAVVPSVPQRPPRAKSAAPKEKKLPQVKISDLPVRYQEFMTLTTYIMRQEEKEVFLQLTNDRDRAVFVDSFWKIRDPTPGTPENEFRVEHERRVAYANKTYGRGAGRPGWMTDRGRFYIILGEPNSIERFDSALGLVPAQVWYYYSDGRKSLPLHFGLVFFQKGGVGEFKLYDPLIDGPKALMTDSPETHQIDSEDYASLYERLLDIAPTLADMSLSFIPGEYGYGYWPSSRNITLLADIVDSPKADIRPTYATHFLDFKGMVSTEYMSNFIESETSVAVLRDPALNISFVHFAIKPIHVSVDYYQPKDQYFAAYSISVSLRRPGVEAPADMVFQYTKDLPYYFSPGETDRVKANGIAIEDSFPVAAGRYKMTVLLQNAVGKEFSLLEQDITVPADEGEARVEGPYFGYRFQSFSPEIHVPFKLLDQKLVIDPKTTFSRNETIAYAFTVVNGGEALWKEGSARITFRGTSTKTENRTYQDIRLRDLPYGQVILAFRSLPAGQLLPDYYEVDVIVTDGAGRVAARNSGRLIVAPVPAIDHPIERAKAFPLNSRYILFDMLAQQYAKIDDAARADIYYKKVFENKPDYAKGLAQYSQFLIRQNRFDEALAAAEKFKADPTLSFEYRSVRGRAFLGKALYGEALADLLEANKSYNSDVGILNALGLCYYKLGKKREAAVSLEASLKLNAGQPSIKALLKEVENMK